MAFVLKKDVEPFYYAAYDVALTSCQAIALQNTGIQDEAFSNPQDHWDKLHDQKGFFSNYTSFEKTLFESIWDTEFRKAKNNANYVEEKKKKEKAKEEEAKIATEETCDSTHACEAQKALQKAKEEKCTYKGLSILTSKLGKPITIDKKNNPLKHNSLEIIAGCKNTFSQFEINVLGPVGPCSKHNHLVMDYVAQEGEKSKPTITDEKFSIEFKSKLPDDYSSFSADSILLNHDPIIEKIAINRCGFKNKITVAIYPDVAYSININLQFAERSLTKRFDVKGSGLYPKTAENPEGHGTRPMVDPDGEHLNVIKSKVDRTLTFKMSYDGKDTTFDSGQFEKIVDNFQKVTSVLTGITLFFKENMGGACDFIFMMPKFTVSGNWGLDVNSDTNQVYKKGSIKFVADPLVGLKFEVDLIKAGAMAAGVPPSILRLPEKIKEWSGEKAELTLSLKFYVSGQAGFELEKEFTNKGEYKITPKGVFELGAELNAELKGEIKTINVKFKASGKAKGAAKFTATCSVSQLVHPKGDASLNFDGFDLVFEGVIEGGIWIFKSSTQVKKTHRLIDPAQIWTKEFDLNT
jgi:hypothetical protein